MDQAHSIAARSDSISCCKQSNQKNCTTSNYNRETTDLVPRVQFENAATNAMNCRLRSSEHTVPRRIVGQRYLDKQCDITTQTVHNITQYTQVVNPVQTKPASCSNDCTVL